MAKQNELFRVLRPRFTEAIDAWNLGDLEGFLSLYLRSEFTTYVVGNETIFGYQNIIEHYRTHGTYGTLNGTIRSIDPLSDEHAIVNFAFSVRKDSHPKSYVATLVMQRELMLPDGEPQWFIKHDHSS